MDELDEISATHMTPIKLRGAGVQNVKTFHSADDNIDRITVYSAQRLEPGVELHISVTDTPGYTSSNYQRWFKTVKGEFSRRFDLQNQIKKHSHQQRLFGLGDPRSAQDNDSPHPNRSDRSQDLSAITGEDRYHLIDLTLFMFTDPTLQDYELELLKKVSALSNVLPVWGKGDCLSPLGLKELKMMFNSTTAEAGIEWFDISSFLRNHHPHKLIQLASAPLGPCPPFIVANPNRPSATDRAKMRRGFWGEFDLENPEHSDFLLLYNLLIGYLCFPLKERTEVFEC